MRISIKKEILIVWTPILVACTISTYLIITTLKIKPMSTNLNYYNTIPNLEIFKTNNITWQPKKEKKAKDKIKISGIIEINGQKFVIINGFFYEEGENINRNLKINKIASNLIIIKSKNKKIEAKVGDEIEIS